MVPLVFGQVVFRDARTTHQARSGEVVQGISLQRWDAPIMGLQDGEMELKRIPVEFDVVHFASTCRYRAIFNDGDIIIITHPDITTQQIRAIIEQKTQAKVLDVRRT